MKKDYREMSIAEAIGDPDCTWGLGSMIEHPIALHERNARRARWERRKARKGRGQ